MIGQNLKAIDQINYINDKLLNSHFPKIAIRKQTHTIQLVIHKYNKIQWLTFNITVKSKTTRSIIHYAKGNVLNFGPWAKIYINSKNITTIQTPSSKVI